MNKLTGMLLMGMLVLLTACGPYKYDSPDIFGLDQYTWYHLSEAQREIVAANQTDPNVKKLNPICFKGCLRCCIPKDGSESVGYNHACFNYCLRSCTPITYEDRFDSFPP